MASCKLECNRCGQCCKTGKDNHDCPFLKRDKDMTTCTIYDHRFGTKIAEGYHCGLRRETKYDFVGCPYNANKPIFKE